LDSATNQRSIPFGKFLQLLGQEHHGHLLCFLSFHKAEEVDGAGNKGSEDTIMVDVQTLMEAFLEDFGTLN
jgi:hypothetical protein